MRQTTKKASLSNFLKNRKKLDQCNDIVCPSTPPQKQGIEVVNKWLLVWLGPRIKGSGKINCLSHCTSSRVIIITIKPLILLLAQLSSSLLVSWECTRKTFLATGSTFSWTTISHKLLILCTRPNNKIVIYGHTETHDPRIKFPLYPDPSPNVANLVKPHITLSKQCGQRPSGQHIKSHFSDHMYWEEICCRIFGIKLSSTQNINTGPGLHSPPLQIMTSPKLWNATKKFQYFVPLFIVLTSIHEGRSGSLISLTSRANHLLEPGESCVKIRLLTEGPH